MRLREQWSGGRASLGGWCVIPNSFSAELMGRAGFDWVCIDTQHGLIGYDAMVPMLQALAQTGTPAFVRVRWNEPAEIMKALDAGAEGVIVPMVNSAAEARSATGACRYPPDGYRSWGPTRAALQVSGFEPASANHGVVCAVMVETAEAVSRIDEILEVPGIDAVFVGPNDMAVTAGAAPSDAGDAPQVKPLIENILDACTRHKITAGIYCGSARNAIPWRAAGFRMLAVATDASTLRLGAQAALANLRQEAGVDERRSSYS